MTFISSTLGEVQHPINILHEYLGVLKNKCQAAIVSWLDGWAYTKRSQGQDEWAWLTLSSLSKELGYCRDTIHTHLKKLLCAGVIERRLAKRWPTDKAWAYRLVGHKIIEKILLVENQTIGNTKPDYQEPENQTINIPISDYIPNTSPNPTPKPNLRAAEEFFQEEEVIDSDEQLATGNCNSETTEEVSEERKQEILEYMGVTSQEEQSSAPDLRGEKIPESLHLLLDKAGVEVCAKVTEAIASHHLSQALSAAQHCIDTGSSVRNPKGVFLFQISRQPVEPTGPRLPVRTAADFQVEAVPCPEEIRREAYKIIQRIKEEVNPHSAANIHKNHWKRK